MTLRAMALLSIAGLVTAPSRSHINRAASIGSVSFDRILHASREPQNWLTYSGGYASQRYSELTQLTPHNVNGLKLRWTLPSRDRNAHEEVTPLVVDGVMYTTQRVNDVIALDAATGKTIWTSLHNPDPAARTCCAQMPRGLAILDRTLFLA